MRLTDMRVAYEDSHYAYGGNEVELSVWDLEKTFSQTPSVSNNNSSGTKRKKSKSGDLFPAEIWRAKNLANDFLSLRQPVHITSLAFLRNSGNSSHHLVTGTHSGAIRRYDTRAARRPVNNWENIAKSGGVRHIANGLNEHQIFLSDNTSSLLSLDLRTGRPLYSYHHISGSITCVAPTSTNHIASVSLDRFFRIHTAPSPPTKAGENQSVLNKAGVVIKAFTKSTPHVVVWDEEVGFGNDEDLSSDEGDDVWDNMEINENGSEEGAEYMATSEDNSEPDRPTQKKKSRLA
ncbi:hypothetical protein FRC02_003039 [Tulasnella sp. 418]|nr:hypothetical protein FRC02_003039 [Tulasnella sp. 418]